eukprot:2677525-Rhodomonas_salina.3
MSRENDALNLLHSGDISVPSVENSEEYEDGWDVLWDVYASTSMSYEVRKRWFEKCVKKVLEVAGFMMRTADNTYKQVNETQLRSQWRNLYYTKASPKVGDNTYVETPFLETWLRDKNMLTYRAITSDPQQRVHSNILNIWPGIRAQTLQPVPHDEVERLVAPIKKHVDEIVAPGHGRYHMAWYSNIVKNPGRKSRTALIVRGKQGAGKDIIPDFFRTKVLGPRVSHQTSSVDTLIGTHATGLQNTVFVCVDEASSQDFYANMDKVKNLITCDTHTINEKYCSPITVPSFCNLYITTNNMAPVSIPSDDRRFVVFEADSCKTKDYSYFTHLAEHLDDDRVARAFYQYLLSENFDDLFPLHTHRPHTSTYVEMQNANLPLFFKYLSYQCTSQEFASANSRDLLASINEWASIYGYKYTITHCSLSREMSRIHKESENVLTLKRARTGVVYHVNWDEMRLFLEKSNLWDTNWE